MTCHVLLEISEELLEGVGCVLFVLFRLFILFYLEYIRISSIKIMINLFKKGWNIRFIKFIKAAGVFVNLNGIIRNS